MTRMFPSATLLSVPCRAVLIGIVTFASLRSLAADGLAGLVEQAERMENASPPAAKPAVRPEASPAPPPASAKPDTRQPVPDDAAVRRARLAVAAIFEDKASKARTPDEWTAVAREMFGVLNSIHDPTERYAIQIAALDVASRGNDPQLLFDVSESLANDYRVEWTVLIPSRLDRLAGPITAEVWKASAPSLRALVESCLAESRYDEAGEVITAYAVLGKRAKDTKAAAASAALRKSLAERRKSDEKIAELLEAAKSPDADSKVFTELGRIMCFARGDWRMGLPYLARSSDVALAKCASMDIAAKSPDQKLAVADAWARFAGDAPPAEREPYYDRASSIYSEVLPTLSGLAKVKAEKALDAILDSAPKGREANAWFVIFRSADPKIWNTDSQGDPRSFAVPLASVPATMRFVRLRRANGATVIMPLTKNAIATESKGDAYGWQGTRKDIHGAIALGIFDAKKNVDNETGKVALYVGAQIFSGWGFGHRIRHGGPTEACWDGGWIPLEPLEIAVSGRQLTPEEKRWLLE